jgi:hypothetical protein
VGEYATEFFLDSGLYIVYYVAIHRNMFKSSIRGAGVGNKVLRSIYIEVEQLEKLKALSQRTKVPQAVYIREALDLILQKYAHQLEPDTPQSHNKGSAKR